MALLFFGAFGLSPLALSPSAPGSETVEAVRDISFSSEQAVAGARTYRRSCAPCHKRDLGGEALAPALVGARFATQWRGRTADHLMPHVQRMPLLPIGEPGSLSEAEYTNVLAFLLEKNGIAPGAPLEGDSTSLAALRIPGDRVEGGAEPDRRGASATGIASVTPERLASPPAEDWLTWRRTRDGHGFSPLDLIDRSNVDELGVAWRRTLTPGESMASPLVHDGVLFLHTFPDTTLALDATTGAEIWRYVHEPDVPASKKMGLALAGDRVFVPTSDLHVLALDLRSGERVWEHAIETEVPREEHHFQLRSAPIVANGMVLQGIMSFRAPRGGFVVGLDAETGEERWRFHTVARPGEIGGETWNDLPLDARNGGSVWVTGAYDPELDLVFFGPAPTYDTAPLMAASTKEGVNNDALFTNTTVALRPKTGELVWYHQHLANDQWDLDWAFERQLVELAVDGKLRKAVVTVGKSAIVEALDAETGEYLFSIDLGLQNVIRAIDPQTGEKTIWQDSHPSLTTPRLICPTAVGARSWPPTSYDPRRRRLFLPLTEGCMIGGPEGFKGLLTSGVGLKMAPHPASSDGNMGRLQAVDLGRRQMAWSYRQEAPWVSSTLATAGDVVFAGDLEPSLKAFDAATGEVLWRQPLGDTPGSTLITYAVDGVQYVAVVVGQPNNVTRDWDRIRRQFAEERGETVPPSPAGGAAIEVFRLAN
ncbi:MAG: PQQ-binding-like beta-propeller repeat protein [Acidobacteriota bacterium]